MSRWVIPPRVRDLSRGAQRVLLFCLMACDEDTGEVEGGKAAIMEALGIDESNVRRPLAELEQQRMVRRIDRGNFCAVVVVRSVFLPTQESAPACRSCGELAVRGKDWCPKCAQVFGRSDRAWKAKAVDIWQTGAAEGLADMAIAYRIHVATGRTLWGSSIEGEQGSGTGSGEGVIPAMVELGLFPPSMLEYAKRARRGGGASDEW